MGCGISRRNFVVGAAALAAVGTVAACGGETKGLEPGVELISLDALEEGTSTLVTSENGTEVVVSRISSSEVRVFSAICTHQGCTVVADTAPLMCPCHGSTFDAETGENLSGPAPKPLPEIAVEVVDGVVRAV